MYTPSSIIRSEICFELCRIRVFKKSYQWAIERFKMLHKHLLWYYDFFHNYFTPSKSIMPLRCKEVKSIKKLLTRKDNDRPVFRKKQDLVLKIVVDRKQETGRKVDLFVWWRIKYLWVILYRLREKKLLE